MTEKGVNDRINDHRHEVTVLEYVIVWYNIERDESVGGPAEHKTNSDLNKMI